MEATVICPHCDTPNRLPATVLGEYVRCSACQRPYRAMHAEEDWTIPTLQPTVVAEPDDEFTEEVWNGRWSSFLVGLSLLPFSIPLLWLVAPLLTGKETIFSLGLPLALAIGSTGLSLGVVLAADWSFGTRIKGILAIVCFAYFVAGFLYFLKKEWMEELRRRAVPMTLRWPSFSPPNRAYTIDVPQRPQLTDATLVAGWTLQTYRTQGVQRPNDAFFVAHGSPPVAANALANAAFFEQFKQGLLGATPGEIKTERDVQLRTFAGHEFVLEFPDAATRRIVRVFRIRQSVVLAAVEGAFLTSDAPDVRRFFKSLDVRAKD